MNVLLDTHVLLWLTSRPTQLDAAAVELLTEPATNIWVTAASAWEIAIKTRLGRLDGATLLSTWSDVISSMNTAELSIDSQDAILAAQLPWQHKDPFDRVIVAQAVRRNLTIATRDTRILEAALTATIKA